MTIPPTCHCPPNTVDLPPCDAPDCWRAANLHLLPPIPEWILRGAQEDMAQKADAFWDACRRAVEAEKAPATSDTENAPDTACGQSEAPKQHADAQNGDSR